MATASSSLSSSGGTAEPASSRYPPVAPGDDSFDENRTGLDHLSFSVDSHQDLKDTLTTLDRLGIEHEGIKEAAPGLAIVEFRDPDNIALEISGPSE